MRNLMVFLTAVSLAQLAMAQMPAPVTPPTPVKEIGFDGRGKDVQTTAHPASMTPPSANISAMQSMPAGVPITEIGFDAKTRRDPNGKVIGAAPATGTAAVPAEKPALRSDNKMRSDSSIARDKREAAEKAKKDAQKVNTTPATPALSPIQSNAATNAPANTSTRY